MTDSTRYPLPPAFIQRAREFTGTPVPARDAATVALLRTTEDNIEVYVLKRATTMIFGGLYAFPGGGVDATDHPETIRTDWAERLGVDEQRARSVVGAAARELFEEAGVLLAGPASHPDRIVGDVATAAWEADRAAVQARELTMTDLLAKHDLRLRDDLLFPWSRWVTPEFEPKRFDTWFFVALLPQGQTARDVSGESDGTNWVSPERGIGLAMLPPTLSTLNSISPYREIAEVVAASSRRDAATPVMPRVELTADGGALLHLE
ncbi:MAG: NUDIX hydrolase [Actinoplanes sp.]